MNKYDFCGYCGLTLEYLFQDLMKTPENFKSDIDTMTAIKESGYCSRLCRNRKYRGVQENG